VAESFFVAITYTTAVVYRVTSGHQNALQLILLGTMLELSYFIVQLPTGILADIASRKLCVIAGRFLVAAGFLLQGLSPGFTVQLVAQIPVGIGAALTFGAQEAWLADEAGETELTPVFLRATQLGLVGVIAGSILSGVLASLGLDVPFLVGGGLAGALAITLLFVMPETRFRPPARDVTAGTVTRRPGKPSQTRSGRRTGRWSWCRGWCCCSACCSASACGTRASTGSGVPTC